MELNVNVNGWGMMFGVPVAVVDKYLKLATPSQLKVMLYLLRHQCSSIDTKKISEALSVNEELVEEAIMFWEQTDLFTGDLQDESSADEKSALSEKAEHVSQTSPAITAQRSSSDITLTPSEIASELKRDTGLMNLFRMAEQLTGEPLNHMQQRSLLWQYQYLSVSGDIILTIMSYCRSMGKNSIQYAEKLLTAWWDRGICTMQQINDEIVKDQQRRSYHGTIARTLDMNRPPTPKQREYFDSWQAMQIPVDLIRYAYEKTIEQTNKLSLAYMQKILTTWAEAGYKTREDVDTNDKLTQNSTAIKVKTSGSSRRKKGEIPESPMADAYRSLVYNIDE
ncbi:MAG: DnaD domain protein [Ruminococcus sp.]|nr:DnaD domain protein [Ruminococcus sp.]